MHWLCAVLDLVLVDDLLVCLVVGAYVFSVLCVVLFYATPRGIGWDYHHNQHLRTVLKLERVNLVSTPPPPPDFRAHDQNMKLAATVPLGHLSARLVINELRFKARGNTTRCAKMFAIVLLLPEQATTKCVCRAPRLHELKKNRHYTAQYCQTVRHVQSARAGQTAANKQACVGPSPVQPPSRRGN